MLLMGSATALPQAPTEKTVFMEDMNEQQIASHVGATLNIVVLFLWLSKVTLSNVKLRIDSYSRT